VKAECESQQLRLWASQASGEGGRYTEKANLVVGGRRGMKVQSKAVLLAGVCLVVLLAVANPAFAVIDESMLVSPPLHHLV